MGETSPQAPPYTFPVIRRGGNGWVTPQWSGCGFLRSNLSNFVSPYSRSKQRLTINRRLRKVGP